MQCSTLKLKLGKNQLVEGTTGRPASLPQTMHSLAPFERDSLKGNPIILSNSDQEGATYTQVFSYRNINVPYSE